MGLLRNAASAWVALNNVQYKIVLGRANKLSDAITLDFSPDDFPHLAGLQHAKDVDFGLSKSEIYGGKFVHKVLSPSFDDTKIEKAEQWPRISGRLSGIIAIEDVLDSEFLICQFDRRRVPHNCNIRAKYVLKNPRSGITFFVFLDKDTRRWFCKSIFQLNVADYTVNQAKMTVLEKVKIVDGKTVFSYTHPKFIKSEKTTD